MEKVAEDREARRDPSQHEIASRAANAALER
jgi:hypothetical protein